MMTTAVVDDPTDGPTVLQIAVPISAPGVNIENNWKALGMRGTGSHDISFEEVFMPDAGVALRRPSGKWRMPEKWKTISRPRSSPSRA